MPCTGSLAPSTPGGGQTSLLTLELRAATEPQPTLVGLDRSLALELSTPTPDEVFNCQCLTTIDNRHTSSPSMSALRCNRLATSGATRSTLARLATTLR